MARDEGSAETGRPVPDRFRFGEVEVDLAAMRLTRGGERVDVEPRVFDLLSFLVRERGRVVTKDEILGAVWKGAFVTDNALARAIAQLRRALGDEPEGARYLETVRRRGYRFVAEIEPIDAEESAARAGQTAPVGGRGEGLTPSSAPARRATAGRAVAVLLAAVVLVVVSLAAYQLLSAASAGAERRRAGVAGTPQQLTVSPGYDGAPSFSPDGRHLAFATERPTGPGGELAPEIVVRRLEDGEELQLTRDGASNVDPAWSPDGRWIAYHSMARGGLWLVSPLGGEPRRLTEFGSQPAWSPDARSVVFCSQAMTALAPWAWAASRDALLFVVDVATGAVRQLTRAGRPAGGHGEPAWSPAGSTIVFSAGDELGRSSLWRVPAAGGEPVEIEASLAADDEKLDWRSPVFATGDTLLAVRAGRGYSVWRLPLWGRDGAIAVLPVAPDGIGSLATSPAEQRLAFAAHAVESRISAVPISSDGEAGEVETLITAPLRMSHPRFSPDGTRISLFRARGGAVPDTLVLDLAGGEARVFENLGSRVHWASDTELLVLGPDGATSVDLESGRRRALELPERWRSSSDRARASFWQYAPDLEQVVFGVRPAEASEALELFAWRADEAAPRQLTELGGIAEFPSWSRDRRRLAFQVGRHERPEHDEIWVAELTGGVPPQRWLREPGRSWGPRFDPAGERVVYAAQRGGRWDLAIVADGEPERLLGVNRGFISYVRWPDWSPRGDRIVFEHTRITADVWLLPLARTDRAAGDS